VTTVWLIRRAAQANQAELRDYLSARLFFVNNLRSKRRTKPGYGDFRRDEASLPQLTCDHK
jgi:hypothetical protein